MKASRELVPTVKCSFQEAGAGKRGQPQPAALPTALPTALPAALPTIQVIRRIRASGPRVLLTVLAKHVHDVARAQRGNGAHLCPTLGPGVRPRLCHIVKDEGGFGFSVTQGRRGPFWLVLSTGGAAERAGVPPGARLLEVNGVSVEKLTHNQLSKKVQLSVSHSSSHSALGLGPALGHRLLSHTPTLLTRSYASVTIPPFIQCQSLPPPP